MFIIDWGVGVGGGGGRRTSGIIRGCFSAFPCVTQLIGATLPQWHVSGPGHSAKGVGVRLQLDAIYACTLRMWLCMK